MPDPFDDVPGARSDMRRLAESGAPMSLGDELLSRMAVPSLTAAFGPSVPGIGAPPIQLPRVAEVKDLEIHQFTLSVPADRKALAELKLQLMHERAEIVVTDSRLVFCEQHGTYVYYLEFIRLHVVQPKEPTTKDAPRRLNYNGRKRRNEDAEPVKRKSGNGRKVRAVRRGRGAYRRGDNGGVAPAAAGKAPGRDARTGRPE